MMSDDAKSGETPWWRRSHPTDPSPETPAPEPQVWPDAKEPWYRGARPTHRAAADLSGPPEGAPNVGDPEGRGAWYQAEPTLAGAVPAPESALPNPTSPSLHANSPAPPALESRSSRPLVVAVAFGAFAALIIAVVVLVLLSSGSDEEPGFALNATAQARLEEHLASPDPTKVAQVLAPPLDELDPANLALPAGSSLTLDRSTLKFDELGFATVVADLSGAQPSRLRLLLQKTSTGWSVVTAEPVR